eukprot:m.27433 g.27433  ORF g.27433 m.27433 type:complete len:303 (+) comp7895_c0_seq2:197-1105(+)
MPILHDLLAGGVTGVSTQCILDSRKHRADRHLLKPIITSHTSLGRNVIVVLLETFPSDLLAVIPNNNRLAIVDCVTIDTPKSQSNSKIVSGDITNPTCVIDGVCKALRRISTSAESCKTSIVIDSMSAYLTFHNIAAVCDTIQILSERIDVEYLISILHEDMHEPETVDRLTNAFSARTRISSIPNRSASKYALYCRFESGKITQESGSLSVTDGRISCDVASAKSQLEEETEKDPTKDLTFNLNLNDQARVARAQLKLPYTHSEVSKEQQLEGKKGGNIISYEPDEEDDFDEEDPDDDLDF